MSLRERERRIGHASNGRSQSRNSHLLRLIQLSFSYDVSPRKNLVLKFLRDVEISLRFALRLWVHRENPKSLYEVEEYVLILLFGIHS